VSETWTNPDILNLSGVVPVFELHVPPFPPTIPPTSESPALIAIKSVPASTFDEMVKDVMQRNLRHVGARLTGRKPYVALIHHNLKPENVFVEENREVSIVNSTRVIIPIPLMPTHTRN
jgi:hypothetical protein